MLTFISSTLMPESDMCQVSISNRTDKPVSIGHLSVPPGESRTIWRPVDKIVIPEKGRKVTGVKPVGPVNGRDLFDKFEETTAYHDNVTIDGIEFAQV